jgi:hypothetical protein
VNRPFGLRRAVLERAFPGSAKSPAILDRRILTLSVAIDQKVAGAVAAPPITAMNSRRRMCSSRAEDRTLPHRRKKSPVLHRSKLDRRSSAQGLVSRVSPVQTALRNCTRDEGGPFEVGNQVLISSHRKLLLSKATVVNVAETSGQDSGRQG